MRKANDASGRHSKPTPASTRATLAERQRHSCLQAAMPSPSLSLPPSSPGSEPPSRNALTLNPCDVSLPQTHLPRRPPSLPPYIIHNASIESIPPHWWLTLQLLAETSLHSLRLVQSDPSPK
eukprot:3887310-Rhodomonas_salina.1